MGNIMMRTKDVSKRVIWCDTEGGVRGVAMWDVTFIDEGPGDIVRALRMFDVSAAHKPGRAKLRKVVPPSVYHSAIKMSKVCLAEHVQAKDGNWTSATYRLVGSSMKDTVAGYLAKRAGCVLCAWNMKGHDRHVLRRLVGTAVLDRMVLWDALPWFRSAYTLPKNTLASDKPGTPRHVFGVQSHGQAHTSMADAAHLRDVVTRAAYCLKAGDDTRVSTVAWIGVSRDELFLAAQEEITQQVSEQAWIPVPMCSWTGTIPESIKDDT